jgi:hypothetical protein
MGDHKLIKVIYINHILIIAVEIPIRSPKDEQTPNIFHSTNNLIFFIGSKIHRLF